MSVRAQESAQQRPAATDILAPDIPGVIAGGTTIHVIKEGFQGTEGALGMPDGSVVFTEQNADRLVKIDRDDNVSIFLEGTGRSIGLALDSNGRLISTQTRPQGQTKVGVIYPKGSERVLANAYEGKNFAQPNDLVVDRKGGVYFTDLGPTPNQPGSTESGSLPAVYYISPTGNLVKVVGDVSGPNGITLSTDERTLYVNNRSEYILAFDVQPDGTLSNRRNHAKYDAAMAGDGLAIDGQGRLYAAAGGGVQIFDPTGRYLGKLPVRTQNLAFAGPDKKTLYMVGQGVAYRARMLSEGFRGRAK